MDIEQLKLIIETVNGITGAAYWVAIVFLGKMVLGMLLGYSLAAYSIYKALSIISPFLQNATTMAQIRRIVGISDGYCSYSEITKVLNLVKRGMAAE